MPEAQAAQVAAPEQTYQNLLVQLDAVVKELAVLVYHHPEVVPDSPHVATITEAFEVDDLSIPEEVQALGCTPFSTSAWHIAEIRDREGINVVRLVPGPRINLILGVDFSHSVPDPT